ncbi:MAG: sigma-70 family RNA polymerase sigma factor [Actinobacteria bacterium]|nr:sigma-70 family RNA polymerase sigma factor [Actinomycetota bacterium]
MAVMAVSNASRENDLAQRLIIAQEVLLHAWARAATFDPERGSMPVWLGLLTQTAAVRWVRRREAEARKAQRQRTERYLAAGPDEVASAEISPHRARAALQRLPPQQRRALELAYLGGLTCRQVATELEIPEGTAKSRVRLGSSGTGVGAVASGSRRKLWESVHKPSVSGKEPGTSGPGPRARGTLRKKPGEF